MVTRPRIAIVLPARENFTKQKSGAVALCMRDFAAYSRYSPGIAILGAGPCDYADAPYRRVEPSRRWWKRERAAYADAIAEVARDYDLIEVQNRPYLIGRLRRLGVELALHLHNDPQTMDFSRSVAERAALLKDCRAIYCVSGFIRDRFLEGLADPQGRVAVIHNGVPLETPDVPKAPLIAFTGRVIPIKGVAELVRAFAMAAPDLPGWKLVVAGGDPDGLLSSPRSPVARDVAALGERLERRGQVSHAEALSLLASAEIAAVPSLWDDPCPRAAIEALAAGCALIATNRGGLAEIAEGAGLMVEPADTSGFAAALRRLASDGALRRSLQAAGTRRARERFDIVRATQKLDAARAAALAI